MADKKLSITIDGKEVACNFGINYFFKHFHELTGRDLMLDGFDGIASVKLFETIPALYCAGYLAECSLKKADPVLTKQDFEHHVLSIDQDDAAKMLTDYVKLVAPPETEKQGEE